MTRKDRRAERIRAWPMALAATAAFAVLATMPLTLAALHVHLQPVAATTSNGVKLLPAPNAPAPVRLSPVARPIAAGQLPAPLPSADSAHEAAAVAAEDKRIRTLLHDAVHIYQPQVVPVRGALPTLVLTAASHPYTAADLVQYGALVMLPNSGALLLNNVFVATNAQLSLGGANLRMLYLDSSTGGFASIVAWGGSLSFHGTEQHPMTIMGWDRADSSPAAEHGYGRSYIREVGGSMTLTNTRVSSLGFWSGRTGGVAWTGITGKPSTGSASNSTFTNDTYGAFLSRSSGVTFRNDLFEFNQLDGLRVHRYSTGTRVLSSSAARNGGNGFIVSRATRNTVLNGDVSENNGGNGYYIDGRPLVNGASASGGSATPGSGAVIENSAALNNARLGILVEGGTGTVIEGDQVCALVTAIALRYNAINAVLTGNDIRCGPRTGVSIGPVTPGAMISGNTVVDARMGILVRDAGAVELDNNRIVGATVFGITARGATSRVSGVGNVLSGSGFRAVDARADAAAPSLSSTNLTGWTHHAKITFWSYLRFHPLAALWLSIAILVILAAAWSHRKKPASHPYPASTHWRSSPLDELTASETVAEPAPVTVPIPALAGVGVSRADAGAGTSRADAGVGASRADAEVPVRASAPWEDGGSSLDGTAWWESPAASGQQPYPSSDRGHPSSDRGYRVDRSHEFDVFSPQTRVRDR